MNRRKFAAALGGCALFVAMGMNIAYPVEHAVAGGSGDSSTTNTFAAPTVPPMAYNPTAMSVGQTITAAAPGTGMPSIASPTFKATAAATCVNNGQCP